MPQTTPDSYRLAGTTSPTSQWSMPLGYTAVEAAEAGTSDFDDRLADWTLELGDEASLLQWLAAVPAGPGFDCGARGFKLQDYTVSSNSVHDFTAADNFVPFAGKPQVRCTRARPSRCDKHRRDSRCQTVQQPAATQDLISVRN